ncbi:MAG: acetyl-CoA synthase subunit gamma, partial [Deltaproteobacteria bacterium]|nr:acetyl-CoA synthase subunit gamma [Deltaproteobacteria bacterium]
KGVNVWCAAGKGAFGADELIHRFNETSLSKIVSHKTLILPQLSASGVNAAEVKRRTGFSVVYGPVRAKDVKAFLQAGSKATREMRTVKFTFLDRLILTPIEVAAAAKKSLLLFGVLFLLNMVLPKPFGPADIIAYAGAALIGTVATPVLLPFIPGRAFSFKGGLLGLIWAAIVVRYCGWGAFTNIGYMLALPSVSAYLAMKFTGSSTYTSPSGVLKEMKIALPPIIGAAALGVMSLLIGRLL